MIVINYIEMSSAASPRKRPKKQHDVNVGSSKEEAKRLNELMHQANIACEESSNMFTPEFQDLLNSLKNWLGLSQVAFATPTLVVVGFLLDKARVKLLDVDMDQPLNFWGVIIACPGCKKTPVCKHMSKNLE